MSPARSRPSFGPLSNSIQGHIDTALAYGNENEVGEGIKDSGVPREEVSNDGGGPVFPYSFDMLTRSPDLDHHKARQHMAPPRH